MGYYNPIIAYGEEKILDECKRVGVNGHIIVDLPPEECEKFRNLCKGKGYAYFRKIKSNFFVRKITFNLCSVV